MSAPSPNNTQLQNRLLWYDGSISVAPSDVEKYVGLVKSLYVTEMSADLQAYNKLTPKDQQISVKVDCHLPEKEWTIPQKYKTLRVADSILEMHDQLFQGVVHAEEFSQREHRLIEELKIYKQMGLQDVLRTSIWLIMQLTKHNVVWGVGRGSSTSSYVLYVIGVHDVDSYKYNLDYTDFLHS